MSKGLKNMSIEELQAGYEKGKVTDEEIEQHLLEQIHKSVSSLVKLWSHFTFSKGTLIEAVAIHRLVRDEIKKLAEHEYQKLKPEEN